MTVPIVAMALELPADYFSDAFAEPNCAIRLIHTRRIRTRRTTSSPDATNDEHERRASSNISPPG